MTELLLRTLAAFCLFGVLGCAVSDNVVGELPVRFLWVPKEGIDSNAVFTLGKEGAETKALELTRNGNVAVEVVYEAPNTAKDAARQAAIVRSAIARRIDGVAVSCDTKDVVTDAIADVVAAGIPVMTFDSDCRDSGRFTHLGINNNAAGALAARMLGAAMGKSPERRKIATISGVDGAENLADRVASFHATLEREFPDLEPLSTSYCGDDEVLAAQLVEESLERNPDLGGIFFVGHWPLHGCNGTDCSDTMRRWNEASTRGTVKTIAFDTLQYELAFVRNGQVAGLIGQRYWSWGADAIQILYGRVINHQIFPPSKDSGLDVVCANNCADMEAIWKGSGRSPPQLSACELGGVTFE